MVQSSLEEHSPKEEERQDDRAGDTNGEGQGGAKAGHEVAVGDDCLDHQLQDENCYQELCCDGIETNHEIANAESHCRDEEEYWHLCQVLGKEVYISPVHAVVVLSEKEGELHAKHIDDSKDV